MKPQIFEMPDRPEISADEIAWKERVEAGYAADGVTVEDVERTLSAIKRDNARGEYGRAEGHDTCFYLNSSDPLDVLIRDIDATNERVVTVAGSGEFAQAFMAKGAREVTVFDVSIPAVLYSELRLLGLRRLDFDAYRGMFDTWKKDDGATLFDADAYFRLRDGLSHEAQAYFDALTMEENKGLFTYAPSAGERMAGFARSRMTRGPTSEDEHYSSLIGDFIKTEEEYAALQARATATPVTFRLKDAEGMAMEAGVADSVYLSNIGYKLDASLGFVKKFLREGARRVLFTTSLNQATWGKPSSTVHFLDSSGIVQSPRDINERRRLLAEGARRLPSLDGEPLIPGTEFQNQGLNLRYIDSRMGLLYGVLMEARKDGGEPTL